MQQLLVFIKLHLIVLILHHSLVPLRHDMLVFVQQKKLGIVRRGKALWPLPMKNLRHRSPSSAICRGTDGGCSNLRTSAASTVSACSRMGFSRRLARAG